MIDLNIRRNLKYILCAAAVALLAGCSDAAVSDGTDANVVINEVMSSNSVYAPASDGGCYDWVELKNAGAAAVSLGGWYLSDEPDDPLKWKMPDVSVEPGDLLLIYLSGESGFGDELHANFKLSSAGETLVLSDKFGKTADKMKVPEMPENVSLGLEPNGRKTVFFAEPTPDAENSGEYASKLKDLVFPTTPVVINEFMTNNFGCLCDCDGDCPDWVELYNPTAAAVDLSGFFLSDSIDDPDKWRFPEGTVILPESYLVVFCSGKCFAGDEIHTDFRLGGDDGAVALFTPGLTLAASVDIPQTGRNVSCGRLEDGSYALFSNATPGSANSTAHYELPEPETSDITKGENVIE